eukprot:m.344263 g.344263  ORF g.344263 m.344263 type:complete len:163 (-) comp20643_c0_seq2:1508-1996(-)
MQRGASGFSRSNRSGGGRGGGRGGGNRRSGGGGAGRAPNAWAKSPSIASTSSAPPRGAGKVRGNGPHTRQESASGSTAITSGYNEAAVLKRLHAGYNATVDEIAATKQGENTKESAEEYVPKSGPLIAEATDPGFSLEALYKDYMQKNSEKIPALHKLSMKS